MIQYQELLHLPDATFTKICHEDAMVASVFKITQPGCRPLILKISERPNDYFREVIFLKQFAHLMQVPKIIQLIEPTAEVHGAILMECLSGALLREDELTESLAYEIGQSLALIHCQREAGYGDPVQGKLSLDPRSYFTMKFEEGLKECTSHLPSGLIARCQEYYQSHLNLLSSVDGPCVVHRDFRPGNIMVHEGKLQGIIDWTGARISFAEEDFCALEHGEWLLNAAAKKSLLDGYGSIRRVPSYQHLIPFLRLNKAVATIGFLVKTGKTQASRHYLPNRAYLESL